MFLNYVSIVILDQVNSVLCYKNDAVRASAHPTVLIRALQQNNQAIISASSASSAYLANRLPSLTKVHARDQGNSVNIEFVEEH